jgi:cytosine/adenosine deaminase-related metal-dependent hydrolase
MSVPRVVRAPWIVRGDDAPIADGAVVLDGDGTILDVGAAVDVLPNHAGAAVTHEHAIVTPALVNAHTHIELSALRGRVTGGEGFVPWVGRMMAARRQLDPDAIADAIEQAARELVDAGTAAIGDVGNSPDAIETLARHGIGGWFFHEVMGIGPDAGRASFDRIATTRYPPSSFRAAMAPHALYSTHASRLREIAHHARARHDLVSLHLAEFAAERAFLRDRSGPLATALERTGLDLSGLVTADDPIAAAHALSLTGRDVLAVHLADARRPELDRLAETGTRAVLSPRSNLFIQTLLPPLLDILAAGFRPALGTDSLASNTSLDVLAEAAALRFRFPSASPRTLFAMTTAWGADALDLPALGRIAIGKRPGLLAFDLAAEHIPNDPFATLLAPRPPSRRWLVRETDPTPRR